MFFLAAYNSHITGPTALILHGVWIDRSENAIYEKILMQLFLKHLGMY